MHINKRKYIKCGVPQGSILGPLLFLIYINDIQDAIENSDPTLFADDTAIVAFNKTNPIPELNTDLLQVGEWLRTNKLSLNIGKSKYIHFGRKGTDNPVIYEDTIKMVHNAKYLGVILDDKLKYTSHIAKVVNKVSRLCGVLYLSRTYVSRKHLLLYYDCYIKPNIQYGILVYGCTSKNNLKRIYMVQKRILRTILFLNRRDTVTDKFNELKVLNVYQLHVYEIFKYTIKILRNEIKNGDTYLEQKPMRYMTRSATDGIVPTVKWKTSKGESAMANRVIKLHNMLKRMDLLPQNILTMSKTELSTYVHAFRDNYILGNNEIVDIVLTSK